MDDEKLFDVYLDEAVRFHGHLCAGQMIGVRLALLGLRELGIADPRGVDRKKLVVFVEIDRCATDAIMTVTGCRIGRRNMKVVDNGVMAATFVDIESNRAVRITSLAAARDKAATLYPALDPSKAQLRAYRELADGDLFAVTEVEVALPPQDLPGPPRGKAVCAECGEIVLDCREVLVEDRALCRRCAGISNYFRPLAMTRQPLIKGGELWR
jgi:formylmethanofuran dehydrogenase subunit E